MTRYDAVLFDLLTALLDSWSLWNACAGSPEAGRRWRLRYLELTYGCGDYVEYEELTRRSAVDAGLPAFVAHDLVARWDELSPWPEVPATLARLSHSYQLGVVTNCSEALGQRAAARLGVPVHLVTSARAGAYKPDARPYRLALRELGLAPDRVLFVAGSPADIGGARRAGMDVVWHNRAGLALSTDSAVPLHEATRLDTLLAGLAGPG